MRVPLILGADPKLIKQGATVRLREGNWKFIFENVVDTEINIYHVLEDVTSTLMHDCEHIGPMIVYASVDRQGSERFISLFAERQ